MMRRRHAVPPLLALLLVACALETREVSRLPAGGPADRPSLRLTLSSDRAVYAPGQPVVLTLTLVNLGAGPVSMTTPTSQLYEFAVLQDGRKVWRWSRGKVFPTEITEVLLGPGQTGKYTVSWDRRDQDGRPVAPGAYTAVGVWVGGEQVGLSPLQLPISLR